MQWTPGPRTVVSGPGQRRARRRWCRAVVAETVALGAQAVVATAVGAYRRIPADHPGSVQRDPGAGFAVTAWRSAWWAADHGDILLRLDVAVVVVALVAAAVAAVAATQIGSPLRMVVAWTNVLAVAGAIVAGAGRLAGGPAASGDVTLMAGAFVVAGACVVTALSGRRPG